MRHFIQRLAVIGMALLLQCWMTAFVWAQGAPKVIRVVGDENYPPYLFLNADGKEEGFLVDVWRLWETKTGVKVELKALKWALAQQTLLEGRADVIDNIFETPGRAPYYDFSKPYADLPVAIYRDVSISGIRSLDALRGFKVGVMSGDACIETLQRGGVTSLTYYDSYTKLIQGAMAQDVKVFCLDEYPADFYLYQQGANRQFVKAFELGVGQFHRAVRKGNLETLRLVEDGMAAITDDEMAALREKWLSTPTDYRGYARHAVWVVAALSMGAAMLALWVITLRRTVARRTAEIAQTKAALQISEERLRAVGDNLPDGFVYRYGGLPGQQRFHYVSAGVTRLLELSPEQVVSDAAHIFQTIDPTAIDAYIAAEKRSARDMSDFSAVLPLRLASGQRKWVQVQSHPHRDASGAVFWDGVALDATERVEALDKLAESEARFRRVFEDTYQPILLLEAGRYVAANRAALNALGATRTDELIGKSPTDISPDYQPDGMLSSEKASIMLNVAFEQGCNEFEWEHTRVDGRAVLVQVLITPIRMAGRDVLHVVWRDITQDKQVQRELDEYRSRLESLVDERTAALQSATQEQQAVFDAATVGVILTKNRVIQRCNRTMETLFGYGVGELLGRGTDVFYPDSATYASVNQAIVDSLASVGHFREERELVRKDGTRFWCRKMVQAIDRDDLSKGFAGTFEDITLERQALDEMVKARKLAEEAAQIKSDFLATMSHEIRTPMNSVIGMTYLALRADPSPKIRDYIQKIQSSSQLLLGVINDILDISKLEAQRMTLEQSDFNLEKVLADVMTLFSEKASSKGLELVIDVDADVPVDLVGDALRLGQILINLTSNAVKFTEHGSVQVHVTCEAQEGPHAKLRFEVKDTGIGITEAQRDRLFQTFQQADTSITRKYGGTGLGLSISRRLTELMGGDIGVDSQPGQGSCFWFTVNVGVSSEKVSPDRRSLRHDFRSLSVLVVDDSEPARRTLCEMLRSMGIEPHEASDGAQAVEEVIRADATGHPYALILLDWKMPEMDGLEVAHALQRKSLSVDPIVLMITAYDRVDVMPAATQVGISNVLVKPVTPSALLDAVMGHIGAAKPSLPPSAVAVQGLSRIDELVGARVLLVEDNELNQEVATEFLKDMGLVVDWAENGEVALAKVQHQPYEAVLMDMQMPVMDGLTASQEIRKLPELAALPILAMTANAMASDRVRCLQAGMNDYIAKPIDPVDLQTKLRKWIKPVASGGASVAAVSTPGDQDGTVVASLRGIPGLDPDLGLKQSLGKPALYVNLLGKFCAGQKTVCEQIAQALDRGELEPAERLAHTLKGVSAQVGANLIREQASRLERAIHQSEPDAVVQLHLQDTAASLANLVEALEARLP
ncbi:MAG: response regulator [Aquabacterium sp.]|uniref:response regulator n=1 Tax=Aquabacterium sp. TaxID=1872578 RepID=UPI003BC3085B